MQSVPASDADDGRTERHRDVIEAVAEAENADPVDLDPIYDAIDPDALDDLFRGREGEFGRVVFRYHGYRVTVGRNGRVVLDEL